MKIGNGVKKYNSQLFRIPLPVKVKFFFDWCRLHAFFVRLTIKWLPYQKPVKTMLVIIHCVLRVLKSSFVDPSFSKLRTIDCFGPIFGFLKQFCFEKHRSTPWDPKGMISALSWHSELLIKNTFALWNFLSTQMNKVHSTDNLVLAC